MIKEIDNTIDSNKLQKVCYKNILLKSLFHHIAKSKRNEYILNACDIPKLTQRKFFKNFKDISHKQQEHHLQQSNRFRWMYCRTPPEL